MPAKMITVEKFTDAEAGALIHQVRRENENVKPLSSTEMEQEISMEALEEILMNELQERAMEDNPNGDFILCGVDVKNRSLGFYTEKKGVEPMIIAKFKENRISFMVDKEHISKELVCFESEGEMHIKVVDPIFLEEPTTFILRSGPVGTTGKLFYIGENTLTSFHYLTGKFSFIPAAQCMVNYCAAIIKAILLA